MARKRGVHLYPINASGGDDHAEYVMRAAAHLTLGRLLFLTNVSGIGDDHQTPHIPCFEVQHLNKLVARMVSSELQGQRLAPDPADLLRTVGSPKSGVCTLADGMQVSF